jgi:hypothetical protein
METREARVRAFDAPAAPLIEKPTTRWHILASAYPARAQAEWEGNPYDLVYKRGDSLLMSFNHRLAFYVGKVLIAQNGIASAIYSVREGNISSMTLSGRGTAFALEDNMYDDSVLKQLSRPEFLVANYFGPGVYGFTPKLEIRPLRSAPADELLVLNDNFLSQDVLIADRSEGAVQLFIGDLETVIARTPEK